MARRGDPPPTPAVARVPTPRRRRPGPPRYRAGRVDEAPALASIWEVSIADYEGRLGRPIHPVDLGPVTRLIEHLAATDAERFWVAERAGRPVGFGQASVRGDLWFLGLLFVLPGEQANGVGRELLARTLPGGRAGDPPILATVTDAAQPISNALYARLGLVPRVPFYRYVGRPDHPAALGALPAGSALVEAGPGDPAATALLETLDRAVLGAPRPQEHAFYRSEGRRLFVARDRDAAPLGYGYLGTAGRIGPVAAAAPALLAPLVGHLLDVHVPAGPSAVSVGGETPELARALLEAGFRIDGFPALLSWTQPFAALDRYVLGSYALP